MDDIEIRVKAEDDATQVLRGTEKSVDRLTDAVKRSDKEMRTAGSGGAADYRRRMTEVGETADNVDTRMMGLADGFAGLTDAMKGGQLSLQEMAMVGSDLGSSMYNFVAPSLATAREKIAGLGAAGEEGASGLSKVGKAAFAAAGIAGVLGLAYAFDQYVQAQREAKFEDQIDSYERTGDAAQLAADALDDLGSTMRFLNHIQELSATNGALARDTIEDLRNEGAITAEQYESLNQIVEENSDAFRVNAFDIAAAEDALRSHAEAVAAQTDPMLAYIDAQRQNDEAINRVREAEMLLAAAIDEHGASSIEAMVAQQQLTDAQWANVSSANAAEVAARTLIDGFNSGEVRGGAFEARLRQLADAGLLDAASMGAISRETGIAMDRLRQIAGVDPNITITSNTQQVIGGIKTLQDRINNLRGRDVHIRYVGSSVGVHAGGVGLNADGGTWRGGATLVGEQGPEIVDLPPGAHITPARTSAEMARAADTPGAGGGGPTFIVQGSIISERDLIGIVYDAMARGELAGAMGR